MVRTQTMASTFLIDAVLTVPDPVGAVVALAKAEGPSEWVLDVIAVAPGLRVDVKVPPGTVATNVMVEPGIVVVLTAGGVTPDTIKGAVSDKIAVGTTLDTPVNNSLDCKK